MLSRLTYFFVFVALPLVAQEADAVPGYNYKKEFLKMILSLGFIVLLIVGASWALRRMGRGRMRSVNNSREIKVLEKRPLATKAALYLVEVSGQRMLIGDSPAGLRSLGMVGEVPKNESFSELMEESSLQS